jgi:hypothetical protein
MLKWRGNDTAADLAALLVSGLGAVPVAAEQVSQV